MNHNFRQQIYFFMIFAFCCVFCGCDALYRLLDKKGAEEKELVGDVVPFERNEKSEEIQALLYLYGYNVGKIDGVLGPQTRNAIEQFQADNQLETTRKVDQETWERLNIFKENKLVVDQQLNVPLIQSLLKKAGLDPGKIDGKIGPSTRAAVMAFQKANGLKVDGKIGYQTLKTLARLITSEL